MKAMAAALLLAGCAAPMPPAAPPVTFAITPPTKPVPLPPRLSGTPIQGGLVRGQVSPGVTALTIDGHAVPIAVDGRFILGFDRDAAANAQLVQTHAGGSDTVPIAISPRAWRIERVDAPYRAGKTDAEFEAARPAERAAITAARAVATDAQGWREPLRWPAIGRLSGLFGAQRVYQGKPGGYHSGADVAVPTGTPVSAPADGVVTLATDRPFTLEGRLLMLDHGMGLNSAFLHLSRIDVTPGQHVRRGQLIALSGATGRATGPHLHWSLQWLGAKLDPLLVAEGMPAF
ncbi:M23 family metallopeptidase [Sphingomonas sp.]|jgi:hypothetical protein|uniref:M23 family metallopeptidase n=1 Tax=Sphingomonas sp. TaxID=28214 RepID=UPI002ED8FA10